MCNPYPSRQMMPATPTPNTKPNLQDYGPEPFVIDIENATEQNNMFRTTLWTGDY